MSDHKAIETQLSMALKLAKLAFILDEAKFGWPTEKRAQALACAEAMYDMAKVLAGDHADEIIGPSDGSEGPDCDGDHRMGSSINVIPILIEPEKLSKQELLEKCKAQQQTMILQDATIQAVCGKLHAMCNTAHNLASQLYALVDAFDNNDRGAIALQLRIISDRRKSFQKPVVH